EYKKSEKTDVSIRVITDHIRSTTMMVCDGVLPSNEGRGYVLRRLLRRAARHGRLLGINKPFLYDVAMVVINESKEAYPELAEKADYIKKVIKIEEERFEATVDQGIVILNEFIAEIKSKKQQVIPGEMVFKLHDTYGFPLDLTREIAEENGLGIDEEGFRKEMDAQRKKARDAHNSKDTSAWSDSVFDKLDKSQKTAFVGYENTASDAVVLYIVKDGEILDTVQEGDEVTVILDKTPFYAEMGGQVGDTGVLTGKNGSIKVESCTKTADGKFLHTGIVEKGLMETGSTISAQIDEKRRISINRNHTVTHLLHKALRTVLGDHVHQAGSLVEPNKLRFDFSHFSAMTPEELKKVENMTNEAILSSMDVDVKEMPIEEAKKLGAMALFGEKYGSTVRVVRVEDYSIEFCGGTHLKNTAQAGLVKILGESGVAAGVRRLEALTGEAAIKYYAEKETMLNELAQALKASPQESLKKVESLRQELKNAEKEIEQLRNKLVSGEAENVLANAVDIKGVKVVTARFDTLDMEGLRNTGDMLKNKLGSGVIVLGSGYGDKVSFVVTATKDVLSKGIHSGNIIKEVAKTAGGGGGGRPDMAQAGGRDLSKIDEALKAAFSVIESQIK
ncbi:MAG TPA: alanine--tRNA ligase, partial [Ruminiclostridium sp.]|nr:alanine--tRNA ligase [Ruminiclostridium sp.]